MTPNPPQTPTRSIWMSTIVLGFGRWLVEQRWLILLFLAALTTRLHWNLEIHPLGDYIYSDMNGYVSRADRLLAHPDEAHEYSAFFPYGTHWMLAGFKILFGDENYDAVGIVYAFMGAIAVAATYSAARRATAFPIVAPAVGILGVFYYPHLSLGGYMLSETPFCMFLMLSLAFVLRLVDHGRARDAVGMGLSCALGMIFRPQILLSAAAVGLFWIARRKSMPKVRFVHFAYSAIPIAILLGLSSYHLHFNTGRTGLVSENGTFNLVFARCHNSRIESLPDGEGHGKVHFRPPPYLQLNNLERQLAKRGETPTRTLEPALGDELRYRGYIGDKEKHMEYIRQCVAKTGWLGQLDYTVTNVMLLWRWNIPWPDSGRQQWRSPARWWTNQHKYWLATPALLGLITLFVGGRKTVRQGLFAVNLLALLLLAAVFFGGARHRAPYDFVIIFLAFEVYAAAGWGLLWLARRFLARRRANDEDDAVTSSGPAASS